MNHELLVLYESKLDLLTELRLCHKRIAALFKVFYNLDKNLFLGRKAKYHSLWPWLADNLSSELVMLEQLREDMQPLDHQIAYLQLERQPSRPTQSSTTKEIQDLQRVTENVKEVIAEIITANDRNRKRLLNLLQDPYVRQGYKEGYYYHEILELRSQLEQFSLAEPYQQKPKGAGS